MGKASAIGGAASNAGTAAHAAGGAGKTSVAGKIGEAANAANSYDLFTSQIDSASTEATNAQMTDDALTAIGNRVSTHAAINGFMRAMHELANKAMGSAGSMIKNAIQ
jgi:hypothetical protein